MKKLNGSILKDSTVDMLYKLGVDITNASYKGNSSAILIEGMFFNEDPSQSQEIRIEIKYEEVRNGGVK